MPCRWSLGMSSAFDWTLPLPLKACGVRTPKLQGRRSSPTVSGVHRAPTTRCCSVAAGWCCVAGPTGRLGGERGLWGANTQGEWLAGPVGSGVCSTSTPCWGNPGKSPSSLNTAHRAPQTGCEEILGPTAAPLAVPATPTPFLRAGLSRNESSVPTISILVAELKETTTQKSNFRQKQQCPEELAAAAFQPPCVPELRAALEAGALQRAH